MNESRNIANDNSCEMPLVSLFILFWIDGYYMPKACSRSQKRWLAMALTKRL